MPFLLLMPSYNQARFIREAVDSCLAQTDSDWELWILDNSTDGTPEEMKTYADPRIRFLHEPQRMSPGECLNRLLDQAQGRDFAYVHTDNRLHPDFVARCREALSQDDLALCYCDHRVIDERGRTGGVDRRFDYDLGNLLGGHGLGVSFAATTALAREVGGFCEDNPADDVFFCSSAYGLGPWTHLRKPLVEYRIHRGSRTEAEGQGRVLRAILSAQERALTRLEARGMDPIAAMEARLSELRTAMEVLAAHGCRRIGLALDPSGSALQTLWDLKLLRLSGFGSRHQGLASRPPTRGAMGLLPWMRSRFRLRGIQKDLAAFQAEFRSVVVALAWFRARREGAVPARVHVASPDPLVLWAAQWLRRDLGWEPVLDPGLRGACTSLPWARGSREPGDAEIGGEGGWPTRLI